MQAVCMPACIGRRQQQFLAQMLLLQQTYEVTPTLEEDGLHQEQTRKANQPLASDFSHPRNFLSRNDRNDHVRGLRCIPVLVLV